MAGSGARYHAPLTACWLRILRITLAAIGQMKSGPERELVDRYAERFARIAPSLGMEFKGITQAGESRARDAETRKRDEARFLTAGDPAKLIALDERGTPMSSQDFANLIGRFRDDGTRSLTLAIGGADGLHESLRQSAGRIISFGAMTMPHQLVRILAVEQLYRAATILSGHPYHRD